MGWNAYLARAKDSGGVLRRYRQLEGILIDFSRSQVLPFGSAAADVFEELRQKRIRIGTMDLRVAAITIAKGMTLLWVPFNSPRRRYTWPRFALSTGA